MVLDAVLTTLRAHGADVPELLVMFDDRAPITPAIDATPRYTSPLGRIPLLSRRLRRWMLPLYPLAVRSLSARLASLHRRRPIDLLISSSSAAVKSIRPPRGVPHLCYIHSPARYLWARQSEYAEGSPLRRLGLSLFSPTLRAWDARTSAHVTKFLANSTHIAAEVRRCYGREASVLHPPVRTAYFTPGAGAEATFALVVAAIEPYKRTELAMQAAALAGLPLRIAGDGSIRTMLERSAPPGVTFLGRINDAALLDLYRSARCLIFPQIEDFGIVAAEAVCAGCPVVARAAGGALDIIRDGVTGALFRNDAPDDIARAIASCPPRRHDTRDDADRFSEARFSSLFLAEVLALLPRT